MKRWIFWEFSRTSWQYEVIVVLILVFIFVTPREFFKDQPVAGNLVRLQAHAPGTGVFWVEPGLLEGLPEPERLKKIEGILKARYGRSEAVVGLQPMFDRENMLKGYMAFTRP